MEKQVAQGAGDARPWTEAHQREALRRTYEIAAEVIGAGDDFFPHVSLGNVETVRHFRATLAGHARLDTARIDREVRRVRALAEGRLVRETVWKARHVNGTSTLAECDTREALKAWIARGYIATKPRIVRVTRIRRAVKP